MSPPHLPSFAFDASIRLQSVGAAHAASLAALVRSLAGDSNPAPWWARTDYSTDDALRYIRLAQSERGAVRGETFAIEDAAGEHFGCCSLQSLDWVHGSAAASIWVAPPARRQGLASAALKELWKLARARGLCRLELLVQANDAPALGLVQSVGAIQEGTLTGRFLCQGKRVDALLYALHRTKSPA